MRFPVAYGGLLLTCALLSGCPPTYQSTGTIVVEDPNNPEVKACRQQGSDALQALRASAGPAHPPTSDEVPAKRHRQEDICQVFTQCLKLEEPVAGAFFQSCLADAEAGQLLTR